jgi:hypothetical protein
MLDRTTSHELKVALLFPHNMIPVSSDSDTGISANLSLGALRSMVTAAVDTEVAASNRRFFTARNCPAQLEVEFWINIVFWREKGGTRTWWWNLQPSPTTLPIVRRVTV